MKHVVIDEGSSQTKISWFDREKIVSQVIPSRVVRGAKLNTQSGSYHDAAYTVGGLEYTAAPNMDGSMTTDIPDYQTSDINLILVHEVLRQNGFGGQDVEINVTLPIKDFYQVAPYNEPLINQKKNNLMNADVENMAGHPLANIVSVKVSPEATPAWFDYLLNDNGSKSLDVDDSHKIMVVDAGGTTTDLAVVDGYGNMQNFDSLRFGVFHIAENLRPVIMKRFDRKALQKHHLDSAMRSKEFAGEDISNEVEQACRDVEQDIITGMRKFVADSESLAAVVYVGGGSALMGHRIADIYGGERIIGDEFSIARGLVKSQRG